MKQFILVGMLAAVTACSHQPETAHHYSGPSRSTIETGEFSQQSLFEGYPEFATAYQSYQPSNADQARINSVTDPLQVLVLFGTWCHDSQREVPRLLKLLQNAGAIEVKLFAVDLMKSDPQGIAKQHRLKYTPTFIVLKDGQEIGRIVEKPNQSLAADLIKIIQG